MEKKRNPKFIFLIIIILLLLSIISLSTQYFGTTDTGAFTSVAKFFSNQYQAKIRSSRTYLYGFLLAPFAKITGFFGMKLASLIWLILLILSLYIISGKNKKTFYLFLASPIVWYLGPWITNLAITSLFFLWGYYFFQKYEKNGKLKYLIYSGVFIGLAGAFWNTTLYFTVLFIIVFFFNKKISLLSIFLISLFVGLLPRLILDTFLFNFPFYSIVRGFFGTFSNHFLGGPSGPEFSFIRTFLVLIILPIYFYILYPKLFKENKKATIFITLVFLIILSNAQLRYTIFLVPLILLYLVPLMTKKQFKVQLILSIILSLLIITPYLVQINYSTNAEEITTLMMNFPNIYFNKENPRQIINQDLQQISKDFPNQVFIVGNSPDTYQKLADIYFEKKIKEFVSIEDYNLFLENKTDIVKIEFSPKSNIQNRREIWIEGGIRKNSQDNTDYQAIIYAISDEPTISLENFELIKKYQILSVFKKR